jgi:hypothetical protein
MQHNEVLTPFGLSLSKPVLSVSKGEWRQHTIHQLHNQPFDRANGLDQRFLKQLLVESAFDVQLRQCCLKTV